MMPEQLLNQFKWEAASWKRQLDFIQLENAWLKSRIAEIATDNLSQELLPEVEQFQSNSVGDDFAIIQFRRYLEVFINELNGANHNNLDIGQTLKKQGLIRDNIEMLENDFKLLKKEFNQSMLRKL
jgi:hypothetical protein